MTDSIRHLYRHIVFYKKQYKMVGKKCYVKYEDENETRWMEITNKFYYLFDLIKQGVRVRGNQNERENNE